ncbi:MAG: large repetitive protein, partial [Actinomycetota bacterium]|nr:large repetitive protein [Actinomycetota bacterium]
NIAEITDSVLGGDSPELGNTAGNNGGAIYNSSGDLNVSSSSLSNNVAGEFGDGGAIYNSDNTLSVVDSTVSDNLAGDSGGGLYNDGDLVRVVRSHVDGNTAQANDSGCEYCDFEAAQCCGAGGGGAIYQDNNELKVVDSTIDGNRSLSDAGGIYANDITVVKDSAISNNRSSFDGGGIYVDDVTTITGSDLSDNRAFNDGGGVYAAFSFNLSNSTVTGNRATNQGGGLYEGFSQTSKTLNSTIADNHAYTGGGFAFGNNCCGERNLIRNSTISSNQATNRGGGISNDSAALRIHSSTITGNTAPSGSGAGISSGSEDTELKNTILALNAGGNCDGSVGSAGNNLTNSAELGACFSSDIDDQYGVDPLLAPLASDPAGSTPTHALLPGSPAIDAGDQDGCPDVDQRGMDRPADGNGDGKALCDVGAYEVAGSGTEVLTPDYFVDTTNDTHDADLSDGLCADAEGDCSLRAATEQASSVSMRRTIGLPATLGVYHLTLGDLVVDGKMTIQGAPDQNGNDPVIDADHLSRAFYVEGPSSLKLFGVTVQHGNAFADTDDDASQTGGAIYMADDLADVLLKNSTLRANEADAGGAVYMQGDSESLILKDSTIGGPNGIDVVEPGEPDGNVARVAGGIYVGGTDATVRMRHSVLQNNRAIGTEDDPETTDQNEDSPGIGGGMLLSFSCCKPNDQKTIDVLDGSRIVENFAKNYGGGIADDSLSSTINVDQSNVNDNDAGTTGGALAHSGGLLDLTINGSTLNGNTAGEDGGAISDTDDECCSSSGSATITDSSLNDNEAGGDGGAIYVDNDEEPDYAITGTTMASNFAGGDGGAIDYNGGRLDITDSTLGCVSDCSNSRRGNSAEGDGGAIYTDGRHVSLSDVTLAHNSANYGGAVYVDDYTVKIADSVLTANDATSDGGALYNGDGQAVKISNSEVSNNHSDGNGGGLSNESEGMFLSGVSVTDNSAGLEDDPVTETDESTTGDGGGIYADYATEIADSDVNDNRATGDGGGIYSFDELLVDNSNVTRNDAGGNGGGLLQQSYFYVDGFSESDYSFGGYHAHLENSTFARNSAAGDGGGIFAFDDVKAVNVTISTNTAGGDGGGVFNECCSFLSKSNTFAHNLADQDIEDEYEGTGSAIYNDGVDFFVKDTILASYHEGQNCSGVTFNEGADGPVSSLGHNLSDELEGDDSCGLNSNGDILGPNAGLQPLAVNAPGRTLTHALGYHSAAIDAGSAVCPDRDERGLERPEGHACDIGAFESEFVDTDGDGIQDIEDNCPTVANHEQGDQDHDGIGDPCDPNNDNDSDADSVPNLQDNCPNDANTNQLDTDGDGYGDACDDAGPGPGPDPDVDGDQVLNEDDNCPSVFNPGQGDLDGDGIGNPCDKDVDGDGVKNVNDNCLRTPNGGQSDSDGDGKGDACDKAAVHHKPGPLAALGVRHDTPAKGELVKFKGWLRRCTPSHENTLLKLQKRLDDGTWKTVATKRMDDTCHTFFFRKVFTTALYRTKWPRQDGDHRTGRSKTHLVVVH